jgi:hypothetical protein
MSFWRQLLGRFPAEASKPKLDSAGLGRPSSFHAPEQDGWIYAFGLPSEKATCDISYRGCRFAVSRERVVRGFKLREILESEYLESWREYLGRPLREFERKRHQEYWRENFRGRSFNHKLLICDACKHIDASGFLARIWIDGSVGVGAAEGETSVYERASGKWAIWGGFDPPDDGAPPREVLSPPLLMEPPFTSANEPGLPHDVKANRILECLPLIRISRRNSQGRFDLVEIKEAIPSLLQGGTAPAALQKAFGWKAINPCLSDWVVTTPYVVRFGLTPEEYARDGLRESSGVEIKKCADGLWLIERVDAPEPR